MKELQILHWSMIYNWSRFISQLFELLTESIYFSEYANVNNLLTYNLEVSATLTSLLQFLLYIYNPNLPKTYAILCTKFACDF